LDSSIRPYSQVSDFAADVFAFTITISPDVECFGITCLSFDVLSNGLLVLQQWVERMTTEDFHCVTYFSNKGVYPGLEQLLWLAAAPILVTDIEVGTHDMTGDTGEDDFALAPRSIVEVVVEFIVFVVCSALHIVLIT